MSVFFPGGKSGLSESELRVPPLCLLSNIFLKFSFFLRAKIPFWKTARDWPRTATCDEDSATQKSRAFNSARIARKWGVGIGSKDSKSPISLPSPNSHYYFIAIQTIWLLIIRE